MESVKEVWREIFYASERRCLRIVREFVSIMSRYRRVRKDIYFYMGDLIKILDIDVRSQVMGMRQLVQKLRRLWK